MRTIYILSSIIALCSIVLFTEVRKDSARRAETKRAVNEMMGLQSEKIPDSIPAVDAGNEEHKRILALNNSYLSLRMANGSQEVNSAALVEIARGLHSPDINVRAACEDMGVYMLSDWVLNRQQADWHRSPVVDAFFRVFKSSNSSALRSFFNNVNPEAERSYLNQI